MEFNKKEIEEFGAKLSALGGRLGFEKAPHDQYIDLEEFFLDSTRYVFAEERLARCIENWIRTYGFLISPSKIKRLIVNEKYPYDPAVLGVFLKIIVHNSKQLNLKPLQSYCKKKKTLTYRSPSKVKVAEKYFDPIWLSFNIATHIFVEETQKNLLNFDFTLKQSPELKFRIESDDVTSSDYKAYLLREGKGKSLNHISKKIHAHYSNLHKFYVRFEKFGVIERLNQIP